MKSEQQRVQKCLGWIRWVTLAGLAVSIYLLLLHVRYDVLGASCEIGSLFSCSVLLIEEYSLWFNIPVPIFSILLYATSFIIAHKAYQKYTKDLIRPILYLYMFSCIGLLSTLFMAYIAFFVLKTVCLFCSLLYVVSIVFFVLCSKIFATEDHPWMFHLSHEFGQLFSRKQVRLVFFTWAVVLAGAYAYFSQHATQEVFAPVMTEAGRSIGNAQSSINVEVFSDFQCPACKSASPFLYQIEKTMGKELQVTYRFYPLDPACNDLIRRSIHPFACQASRAAYCASQQNNFWRYHDLLFQNQMNLSDDLFVQLAREENLDIPMFLQCLKSNASLEEVRSDISKGNAYQVSATPTILVNGQPYSGARTMDAFRSFVEGL